VPDGTAITIKNPSALQALSYQQVVLKTLNALGVGVKYAHALLPDQVKAVRHSLSHKCKMCRWTDASRFNNIVAADIMNIENAMPCILHLHKRVIEKIVSLVFLRSLSEQESNKAARFRHTVLVGNWLNEKAFGEPNDPGTYSIPMDKNTGELGEVKFNDNYAKRVEETLADLVPKILTMHAAIV
jgi:hypothetical protein